VTAASSRLTRAVLTVGSALSAACLSLAILLELSGRSGATPGPPDVARIVSSVAELQSWGWAWLGALAVIATPAAGLIATAWEYAAASDRRTALTALAVLAVLGVSLGVALLR
jgi:hypothetical protein